MKMKSCEVGVKVTNVVLQCRLSTELDLLQLARRLTNVIYKPNRFSAVIFRSRKCKGSCLIFRNGKFVTLGVNNITEAIINCRRYMRIIQKICGKGDIVKAPEIVTISAVCNLGYEINLNELYASLKGQTSLEAEIFGALFHKSVELKCHLSVFQSGKVTITGGKSVKHLRHCYREIKKRFKQYRKTTT